MLNLLLYMGGQAMFSAVSMCCGNGLLTFLVFEFMLGYSVLCPGGQ